MERKRLEELQSQSVAASVEAGSNRRAVNGTHDDEVSRLRIGHKGMANDPHDSKRKNKLIMDYHILIDIYEEEYEVKGKFNGKSLKEG